MAENVDKVNEEEVDEAEADKEVQLMWAGG